MQCSQKYKDEELEEVQKYIYSGKVITLNTDKEDEIKQGMMVGKKAFNKNRDKMKNALPLWLKYKVDNKVLGQLWSTGEKHGN